MIQVGCRSRVYVITGPVDFRSGFSALAGIVRQRVEEDPLSGHIFVFKNKANNAVKMICFDGVATWHFCIRFAKGKLTWWPDIAEISAMQLMSLLSQGEKISSRPQKFREVS